MRILSCKLGVTSNATTSRAGLLAQLALRRLPRARGKLALGARRR